MKNIIKPNLSDLYMKNLQDEMNRIMEDAFGSTDLFDVVNDKKLWRPPLEMSENEHQYDIKLQLPGFGVKDIDIEVGEDYISVRAENSFEKEQKRKNLYKSEFRYGNFMRTVSLPSNIDTQNTLAEFKDGILSIVAPKSMHRETVRKLQIKEVKPLKALKQQKAVKKVAKAQKRVRKAKA